MLTLKPFVHVTITSEPRFSQNIHHYHRISIKSPLKLRTCAQNGDSNNESSSAKDSSSKPISIDDNDGNESKKEDRFGGFSFKWGDFLNLDQDNFVAGGLAGVLTWASLQVLSQLFFISFDILVAVLKYSFIAALLIFILVTLL